MLLTPHLLIGALIGLKTQNICLIFVLGIFFHFLIDIVPHSHYDVESLKEKITAKSSFALLKVAVDLFLGFILCFPFIWKSNYFKYALLGMAISILPDALTFIYWQTRTSLLKPLDHFHREIIHQKKEPPFIRGLISQIIISAIVIIFLLFK